MCFVNYPYETIHYCLEIVGFKRKRKSIVFGGKKREKKQNLHCLYSVILWDHLKFYFCLKSGILCKIKFSWISDKIISVCWRLFPLLYLCFMWKKLFKIKTDQKVCFDQPWVKKEPQIWLYCLLNMNMQRSIWMKSLTNLRKLSFKTWNCVILKYKPLWSIRFSLFKRHLLM